MLLGFRFNITLDKNNGTKGLVPVLPGEFEKSGLGSDLQCFKLIIEGPYNNEHLLGDEIYL